MISIMQLIASTWRSVTWVPQGYPGFRAVYSGPQSLAPEGNVEEVLAATAFLGLGLWRGAAIYVAPEIDEGFGVGSKFGGIFGPTFGIAGFPNALAVRRSALAAEPSKSRAAQTSWPDRSTPTA
jgi:hypothetical protein